MKEYFVLYEGISDQIFWEFGQFFSSEISLHLISIFGGWKEGKSQNLLHNEHLLDQIAQPAVGQEGRRSSSSTLLEMMIFDKTQCEWKLF